ncbi:hypothetical protein HDV63DRAFT_74494 [Trichoderma sp. SZMC 28014]
MDAGVNSLISFPNVALERPPSESLASALSRNGESSNPRPTPGIKSDFMRASADKEPAQGDEAEASATHVRALAAVTQQQKTRRRRGSLRKVALLGRGAQRDRRDSRSLAIETDAIPDASVVKSARFEPGSDIAVHNALGLNIPPISSPTNEYASTRFNSSLDRSDRPTDVYSLTTDEEDIIQLRPHASPSLRSSLPLSSGSESYYAGRDIAERQRSLQKAKSPLSYSASSLPQPGASWDYAETEWWGWVVLTVTWFVFVIGMGSCFEVWRWAWDVGKTPYAPPELEDDPTLPIVGYYPALIILTCVMAWVWVVVAWVGMKYFRHAKISGD